MLFIYLFHYLLIFVSLSYGFNIVFFFVFCIFEKKICLPIFAGLFISIYLNLKLIFEKMCHFFFFLYFISHFGEKFVNDHL